jgi:RNase_H superfamily
VSAVGLERRLANFRVGTGARPVVDGRDRIRASTAAAERLAAALDGELIRTATGAFVRVEAPSTLLPVDRDRLATLPGLPPPDAPMLCLDTETTGLATAAGTLAFLIGLGWWEGSRFRQVQLLLPDHADEPAVLAELASRIGPDAWLVTYNGRGFDWPLLVARFRLALHDPPLHAGHLDLLPIVRRVFRHRMPDARLASVESVLLRLDRHADVAGWEIPSRYLEFLRTGEPTALLDVVHHNDEDVRSLARLLVHVDRDYADRDRWTNAPPGDLAGLARAFGGNGRHAEALRCVDAALEATRRPGRRIGETVTFQYGEPVAPPLRRADPDDDGPWWSPRRRPDYGGRPGRYPVPDAWPAADPLRRDAPWTESRLLGERARLLRRLGRERDSELAWMELAHVGGTLGALAWIEVAKLREHRLGDVEGALTAAVLAARIAERQRLLGRPLPRLEAGLARRLARLRRRIARRQETSATRRRTASIDGTPARPGRSTTSDAAAAANVSLSDQLAPTPIRSPSIAVASSEASITSPAPVVSTTSFDGMAG